MRKRYQKGSLRKEYGRWIAQWWQDGHRRKRTLGLISQMSKAEAQRLLGVILAPINARACTPSASARFGEFVNGTYLPLYRRKWKRSSAITNEGRLSAYLFPAFSNRPLSSFKRDELQIFLDEKAASGLSFSTVAHLRWDLRQIFRLAVEEGYIGKNPAELLFVPRDAARPDRPVMNREEVQKCFAALEPRERLIVKLAVLVGLRPGEIFGLQWKHLNGSHVEIRQRVYRGELDSPKSSHSVRKAASPAGVLEEIEAWKAVSPITSADA